MDLLSEYKAQLGLLVQQAQDRARPAAVLDPRQAEVKPSDPRAADPRQMAADPRQAAAEKKPQDPRQAARQLLDPKVEAITGKWPADAQIADPRQKAKVAKTVQDASIMLIDSEDEAAGEEDGDVELVTEEDKMRQAKQILQGLPSLGFSETWLR